MKADTFYIVGMMFIVGVWLARDTLSTIMMFGLGFLFIAMWVITEKRNFELEQVEEKLERVKTLVILEKLDSIEKLLIKWKKKR